MGRMAKNCSFLLNTAHMEWKHFYIAQKLKHEHFAILFIAGKVASLALLYPPFGKKVRLPA